MRILILATLLAISSPSLGQHAHMEGAPAGSHALEMNQRWSAPDVDVAAWVARFEAPDRDVIANRDAIVAALRLQPGQKLADVGAGTGAYLAPLARAVGPDGHLFAVDIAPAFVVHMVERAKAEDLANVSVILGRADSPTLPTGALDTIVSVNTFHHFEAPDAMLKAMHRALKPGGQLAIVDFDRQSAHATDHQRKMAPLDKAQHIRLIEAQGFRLVEDVDIKGLRQNFMLRFERR
jgi:cyclopropane fatty-acyl-phospholipid synthase-like methyltransferase